MTGPHNRMSLGIAAALLAGTTDRQYRIEESPVDYYYGADNTTGEVEAYRKPAKTHGDLTSSYSRTNQRKVRKNKRRAIAAGF